MNQRAPSTDAGRTSPRTKSDMCMAALRASAGGHRHSRGVREAQAMEPRRSEPARRRASRGRDRREEALPMKRLWLAAILSASIASVCLSLTPREAAAWWTGDAYLERRVATEGDPDGPDIAAPHPAGLPGSGGASDADVSLNLVVAVLNAVAKCL